MADDLAQEDFRHALAHWVSGVVAVSTEVEGLAHATTVSSFASVSMSPPLILICLQSRSRLLTLIESRGLFAVSLLSERQADVSKTFSGRDRPVDVGFGEVPIVRLPSGLPAVADASAHLDCVLHDQSVQGDHHICIGRVTGVMSAPDGGPLVYFKRAYRSLSL